MRRALRNQRGQLTIEAVLLLTVFTSIAVMVSKYARSEQLVSKVVEGPWKPIQGMIENGVWETGDKAKGHHPASINRHSSNRGEDVPTH